MKAQLLIDGKPLADDIAVEVFMCSECDGKGRRTVTTGAWINGTTKTSGIYQHEERCDRCRGSGYVVSLRTREGQS